MCLSQTVFCSIFSQLLSKEGVEGRKDGALVVCRLGRTLVLLSKKKQAE